MSVQLTLSGLPVLRTSVQQQDIDVVLDYGLDYYRQLALDTGEAETQEESVRRIGLAILSVHSDFDATVKAFRLLQNRDWSDRYVVRRLISSVPRVQYPRQKAWALAKLWTQAFRDGEDLRPQLDDREYREYLRRTVWGLAWAKSSYAVMLCKGRADVCCIDTHMHRLFTTKVAPGQIRKRLYLELEDKVREQAERRGAYTSVVQHCLWDAMRGVQTPLLPD